MEEWTEPQQNPKKVLPFLKLIQDFLPKKNLGTNVRSSNNYIKVHLNNLVFLQDLRSSNATFMEAFFVHENVWNFLKSQVKLKHHSRS